MSASPDASDPEPWRSPAQKASDRAGYTELIDADPLDDGDELPSARSQFR